MLAESRRPVNKLDHDKVLFTNIAGLVGGRIFISLSRLLIALIVLRLTGVETFGHTFALA